jgi:hypothetical protein
MDMARFWSLIEAALVESGGDCDEMAAILESRLTSLFAEEILGFQEILNIYLAVVFKLSRVFTLMTGLPMSDDSSEDFCMWLIKQGRDVCEAAWTNPEVLADVQVDEDAGPTCEPLLHVAQKAYQQKTGQADVPILPNDPHFYFLPENAAVFPSLTPGEFLPAHESHGWKEWSARELESTCPRLWARYQKNASAVS